MQYQQQMAISAHRPLAPCPVAEPVSESARYLPINRQSQSRRCTIRWHAKTSRLREIQIGRSRNIKNTPAPETPSPKLQAPDKPQTSKSQTRLHRLGVCVLALFWNLGLWNLSPPLPLIPHPRPARVNRPEPQLHGGRSRFQTKIILRRIDKHWIGKH